MIKRRLSVRSALNPLYVPFYDALCAKLGPEWQPYGGIRSFMAQDRDYARGRTQNDFGEWIVINPGLIVTHARGGESPHQYGCATDWTKWNDDDEPLWPAKEDPCWTEFIDAVTAVGLRPGAEFGDVDHCELRISVPWRTIHTVWVDKGPSAANAAIAAALKPKVRI